MLIVLLLVCAIALAAAARLAARLAGGSLLHTAALTIILFSVSLMLPVVYSGLFSQLHLPGLLAAGAVLSGALWVLADRLRPLAAVAFTESSSRMLRLALCAAAGRRRWTMPHLHRRFVCREGGPSGVGCSRLLSL